MSGTSRIIGEALLSANEFHQVPLKVLAAAGFRVSNDRRGLNSYELLFTHSGGHEFIFDVRPEHGNGYLYSKLTDDPGPVEVPKDQIHLHLRPFLPRIGGRGRKKS